MTSKLTTALIILTVAALCAALAFQYMEMEAFGLNQTLKERFFTSESASVQESAPETEAPAVAAEAPADAAPEAEPVNP